MGLNNTNLHKARNVKNDEFYTQLTDIEKEMRHFKDYLKGKSVYCNCDDPRWSNFTNYFMASFEHLGLSKLVCTCYNENGNGYYWCTTNGVEIDRHELIGNGDFRSNECIDILRECDVVITNPPFSLFREFVGQLMDFNKDFIIIGNLHGIKYKEIFPLIKDDKIWFGYTHPTKFVEPNGEIKKFGNIGWYTNVPTSKRNEEIILYKTYNEDEYPKYDNYDAINVSKTSEIPSDYFGEMGVPISFLDKYNPNQFRIVGEANHGSDSEFDLFAPKVNGKLLFPRIIIIRK